MQLIELSSTNRDLAKLQRIYISNNNRIISNKIIYLYVKLDQ